MHVSLVWVTPDAQEGIVYMARVSNPSSQEAGDTPELLIRYLRRNKHWSPFEMAHACVEINTTRDIARQILRHRSFSFQEFSQRYADPKLLPPVEMRQLRLQDLKNRQSSIVVDNPDLAAWWEEAQKAVAHEAMSVYRSALDKGIAKEQARALLPEGLTPSRMYMVGSIRSWIHYFDTRITPGTQTEHRLVAQGIRDLLQPLMPAIFTGEE